MAMKTALKSFRAGLVSHKKTDGDPTTKHRSPDVPNTIKVIAQIKAGLPVKTFFALRDQMSISSEALADIVGIAPRTLARRKEQGKLRRDESERVIRLQRLFKKTVEVFEDARAAQSWFVTPQLGLARKTPLEYAGTELGAREVENLLLRIEHGVFA